MTTGPQMPRDRDLAEADRLLRDRTATNAKSDEAQRKAEKKRGQLGAAFDTVCTLVRLVKAYVSGEYRDVSGRTIALVVAALVYFVSPIDFVPDLLPVIGYTDDVALLLAVAKSIGTDLEQFAAWEKKSNAVRSVRQGAR